MNKSSSQSCSESSENSVISLQQPSAKKRKHRHRKPKAVRAIQSMIRALPIMTSINHSTLPKCTRTRVTVTLFGYKKGKVTLSLQETSKSLPTLVMELPIQTYVLQREMKLGVVRIALECEKKENIVEKTLLEEVKWSMFCNGKNFGCGFMRKAKEEDLNVMELLKVLTMGVGVLLSLSYDDVDNDNELAYVRATFEHVIGSKDSESFHMICLEGNNVPQISIFFVRS